jgi:regulator of replication initiation timing
MSETAPVVVDTPITDHVTKATYDETKSLADERAAKLAAAEAKLQHYEARERATLKSYAPAMEGLVKELAEGAPLDAKSHFDGMLDWTRNCYERPNLDTQMQLGTVVHACASKLKRVREDASISSATAEQLAAAAKENETIKSENGNLRQRVDELSSSLKEIQSNSEKLQLQLEQAGQLKEKFDFSKASSREADAPKVDAGVAVVTENASKLGALSTPVADPSNALFAFVNGGGAGLMGSRFMPSSSNHSLLGAPGGSESIAAGLRPM